MQTPEQLEQQARAYVAHILELIAQQGNNPTVIPIVHWATEDDYNQVYQDPEEMSYDEHEHLFVRVAEMLSEAGQMPYICTGNADRYFQWLEHTGLVNDGQTRSTYANVLFQIEREKQQD